MQKTPLIIALAVALFDCASLEAIPSSTCGNGVVDTKTEDCDSFPGTCGGPSAGAKACRLTCSSSVACPTGWGCGLDEICRQMTGSLDGSPASFSTGASTLLTGDFDADGRTDLVGAPAFGSSASARIHFFDGAAALAETVSIDVALRLPVVRDFDGDGIDDLGFGIVGNDVGAFGALAGRRDRTFSTILFPSLSLPKTRAIGAVINVDATRNALPQNELSALVLVEQDATGNFLRNINNNTAAGGSTSLGISFPIAPDQILGKPSSGIVFTPSFDHACGEVVAAYNAGAAGKLVLTSPCRRTPQGSRWALAGENSSVVLDVVIGGAPVTLTGRGAFVGRWDEDDLDDVFVEVATSTGTQVYVAVATGTGLAPFQPVAFQFPLALGDLNGDKTNDAVDRSGVTSVLPDGGIEPGTVRPSGGLNFADARIGRFNGDDIPDVLVRYQSPAGDGLVDVALLANNGDGRFTTYNIPSDQPVRALESGDYDGDRILDVAFLQSPRAFDDASGSGEIELVIAYGKANGGPETPRVIGRFANARELHTLHSADSAVDNLAVLEVADVAGQLPTSSVTVLFGSGERQPVAPLFLSDDNAASKYDAGTSSGARNAFRVWDPVLLTAGALRQAGHTDLFAIAAGFTITFPQNQPTLEYPFPLGLWVAPSDQSAIGGLSTFNEVLDISSSFRAVNETAPIQAYPLIATIGDIDVPANGTDEIVAFAQTPSSVTNLTILRAVDGDRVPTQAAVPDLTIAAGDPIALGDVNADGAKDLIVITERAGARKALVYLHDASASTFASTPIELALASSDAGIPEEPVAFALLPVGLRTDGKLAVSLVLAGARTLTFATMRVDGSGFDARDMSSSLGTTVAKISSVAAGDFDGDGIPDLAIVDSGTIHVLRQRSAFEMKSE